MGVDIRYLHCIAGPQHELHCGDYRSDVDFTLDGAYHRYGIGCGHLGFCAHEEVFAQLRRGYGHQHHHRHAVLRNIASVRGSIGVVSPYLAHHLRCVYCHFWWCSRYIGPLHTWKHQCDTRCRHCNGFDAPFVYGRVWAGEW